MASVVVEHLTPSKKPFVCSLSLLQFQEERSRIRCLYVILWPIYPIAFETFYIKLQILSSWWHHMIPKVIRICHPMTTYVSTELHNNTAISYWDILDRTCLPWAQNIRFFTPTQVFIIQSELQYKVRPLLYISTASPMRKGHEGHMIRPFSAPESALVIISKWQECVGKVSRPKP